MTSIDFIQEWNIDRYPTTYLSYLTKIIWQEFLYSQSGMMGHLFQGLRSGDIKNHNSGLMQSLKSLYLAILKLRLCDFVLECYRMGETCTQHTHWEKEKQPQRYKGVNCK